MNRFKNKKFRNKKGNVALESVLAGGMLFMVFILIIGYFTYLYPRYMVDLEVQNLAHAVKMDGKLTQSDFTVFIANMENRGYTEEDIRAGTSVTAVNPKTLPDVYKVGEATDGANLIDPGDQSVGVIERNNGSIDITVQVPANDSFLGVGINWFGAKLADGMEYYTINRVVMSEAYLQPE